MGFGWPGSGGQHIDDPVGKIVLQIEQGHVVQPSASL